MINIERDFLQFEHLFHFTGLSNQIQPNELFQKWRCALGIDRIFADLEKEIGTATQFLLSIEQREETTVAAFTEFCQGFYPEYLPDLGMEQKA